MSYNNRLLKYREQMFPVLEAVGLKPRYPVASNNYIFMPYFAPNCHIGISVTQHGLRVTLNLRNDPDEARFTKLFAKRAEIDSAIGQKLDWGDRKDWRQKSVVRAARDGGYETAEAQWPEQHRWAADTALAFELEFTRRLSGRQS